MCGRVLPLALIVAGCLFGGDGEEADAPRLSFHRDPGLTLEEHRKIVGLLRDLRSDDVEESERAQKELFEMGRVVVRYAKQLLSAPETRENVRLAAARVALHNSSPQNVADLVDLLDDPHPLVRHDAATAMKKHTGLTFGYDYRAPAEERKAVMLKWEQWLEQRD